MIKLISNAAIKLYKLYWYTNYGCYQKDKNYPELNIFKYVKVPFKLKGLVKYYKCIYTPNGPFRNNSCQIILSGIFQEYSF